MNTFGTEGWFVFYLAWGAGLIGSNGLGLGMFALMAGTMGYDCFLKLVNQLLQPAACHPAVETRKALRALPLAAR